MLLSKTVMVKLNYNNIEKYKKLGYEFETFTNKEGKISVRKGVTVEVKIEDLDPNCSARIVYECDYCKKEVEVRYCDYMRHYPSGVKDDKDCCKDCSKLKTKEILESKYGKGVTSPFSIKEIRDKRDNTVKEKYGVENVFQVQDVKDKIVETCLEKYGVEYYVRTEEYKEKTKETCLKKYGCDNVSKCPEIIDKIKNSQIERYGSFYSKTDEYKEKYRNTCIEKYGVVNLFQSEFVKEKIIKFNINKYGVEHPMKNEEEKDLRIRKMVNTKYRNGTGQSSRQQDYLHKIYGGEINFPMNKCLLDIAFVEDKVFCEYDGSGHRLAVKFGDYSEKEFIMKEMQRKYYMFSLGWKEFRIISDNDYLPSDDILLDIKRIAVNWFSNNHKWIKFYINDNKYETSNGFSEYNFGKLRKIKDDDLESVI